MPAPEHITPAQLNRLVGTPDCPVLLDLRTDEDVAAHPALIPTARRVMSSDVLDEVPGLVGRRVVALCHGGRKISQGAAALLRSRGIACEVLDGGTERWRALPDAQMVPLATHPGRGSVWVTRHRPKIDRIACPWLIRRFVDPEAVFLFVEPAEVMAVAERFGATPFDVADVPFSHRGPGCTLDTMIEVWTLETPALSRLATVVRAADTNRHDLAPEAAGLLALSVGLSRQFKSDLHQLDAGLALYDALYRWARDGQGEGHDWAPEGK
ncbi:sulfurtransferase/chromate resistance protein [Maritimibacter sp. DP1N21-5]|uniref:chromate resistance protein ChrB domain-containing protein n=1 Tax=Maritimibacter sp. DP1N21-5 TaxID=2836867 RepID=UPI001C481F67|nr:sulfurtransferase/chromate resistance protein [Maritimibacter sp. DP1N21-5]MBV7409671.1 sulfurtransferase/chromate resistance protein [Maritimibacter sp. DP1N21-5]